MTFGHALMLTGGITLLLSSFALWLERAPLMLVLGMVCVGFANIFFSRLA